MSKSLKRHQFLDSGEHSDRKIKALKKREAERKLARLILEEYDDEAFPYSDDPRVYRITKERR